MTDNNFIKTFQSLNITCSLSCLGQECPQLQDALFFNSDSFLIVLLNISPHYQERQQVIIRNNLFFQIPT